MSRTLAPGNGLFDWFDRTMREINEFGLLGPIRIRITARIVDAIPRIKLAWSYLWWLASPPASKKLHRIRDEMCNACPIMTRVNGRRYCGGCGCGQRKDADLEIKNGRIGHNCPLGKHPGSVAIIHLPVVLPTIGDGI